MAAGVLCGISFCGCGDVAAVGAAYYGHRPQGDFYGINHLVIFVSRIFALGFAITVICCITWDPLVSRVLLSFIVVDYCIGAWIILLMDVSCMDK